MLEPMFEVPGSGIVGVQVTEDYVKGEKGPIYVRSTSTTDATTDEEDLTSIRLKQWDFSKFYFQQTDYACTYTQRTYWTKYTSIYIIIIIECVICHQQ